MISSENSIDRDFLVNTSSSSKMRDDCSPDKSMTSFYRASILMMSQPLEQVKQRLGRRVSPLPSVCEQQASRGGGPSCSTTAAAAASRALIPSSDRLPISEDQFSFDSFCVPDEQTIEYDEDGPSDHDL